MNPVSVSFKDFEITDPDRYCRVVGSPASFWPLDWDMVTERENSEIDSGVYRWLRDNCIGRYEVTQDTMTGLRVFAFENDEDSVLFKLKF